MRTFVSTTLHRLAAWLRPKSLGGRALAPAGTLLPDGYRRRQPTDADLLAELKGAAWTCAGLNAAVCASYPPRLYVSTAAGDPPPRCLTRGLAPTLEHHLRGRPELAARAKGVERIEEVVDHPLLTLLRQVNPQQNGFDLWEHTQLSLEVHGCAYWYLEADPDLGVPESIWVLPAHRTAPRRGPDGQRLVDCYEYHGGGGPLRIPAASVIAFRCPDLRDPYTGGVSPLRACYEQAALTSDYAAMKRAVYENGGLPGAVLSPADVISPEDRDRLERQWNQTFRRGGAGRVLVSDSALKVDVLAHSMGDLAALADLKGTKEDIANAFGVPLPFLSPETNLANMQAADHLYKTAAIRPRLRRRDEKLNEQLVPLYDPSGRLFLMSDDPTPAAQDYLLRLQEADLRHGVRTVNEIRSERGLPPVPWGDQPHAP